jgi:hypothetical protein
LDPETARSSPSPFIIELALKLTATSLTTSPSAIIAASLTSSRPRMRRMWYTTSWARLKPENLEFVHLQYQVANDSFRDQPELKSNDPEVRLPAANARRRS